MITEMLGPELAADAMILSPFFLAALMVFLFARSGESSSSGVEDVELAGKKEVSKIIGFGRKFSGEISSKLDNFVLVSEDVVDSVRSLSEEVSVLSRELQVLREIVADLPFGESATKAETLLDQPFLDNGDGAVEGVEASEEDAPGWKEAVFGDMSTDSESDDDAAQAADAFGGGIDGLTDDVVGQDGKNGEGEVAASVAGEEFVDDGPDGDDGDGESPFAGFSVPDGDDLEINGEEDEDGVDELLLDEY